MTDRQAEADRAAYLAGLKRELSETSKPEKQKQIQAEIDRVSPKQQTDRPKAQGNTRTAQL